MGIEKLKTINIKGKEYVPVAERVRYFSENYPKGMITTEIITHENGLVLMQAIIIPDIDSPNRKFTGYAQEEKGKGLVNTLSYIENCESSAVGRALGFAGIGIDTSIASADEISNVIATKPKIEPPQRIVEQKKEPDSQYKLMLDTLLQAKKRLGEDIYLDFLITHGYKHSNEIKTIAEGNLILGMMKKAIKITEKNNES